MSSLLFLQAFFFEKRCVSKKGKVGHFWNYVSCYKTMPASHHIYIIKILCYYVLIKPKLQMFNGNIEKDSIKTILFLLFFITCGDPVLSSFLPKPDVCFWTSGSSDIAESQQQRYFAALPNMSPLRLFQHFQRCEGENRMWISRQICESVPHTVSSDRSLSFAPVHV